jgi:hypothetical protein
LDFLNHIIRWGIDDKQEQEYVVTPLAADNRPSLQDTFAGVSLVPNIIPAISLEALQKRMNQ